MKDIEMGSYDNKYEVLGNFHLKYKQAIKLIKN